MSEVKDGALRAHKETSVVTENDETKLCPVCGERDPYPQWFCLPKAMGIAKPKEPCSYSLDAFARAAALRSRKEAAL